jgi:hypothetical protein
MERRTDIKKERDISKAIRSFSITKRAGFGGS